MARINEKIDRDAPASVVARKFGSPSKLAQAIGRSPSTVQRWLESGFIPGDYHPEIVEAGARLKLKPGLVPGDFVDARMFKQVG